MFTWWLVRILTLNRIRSLLNLINFVADESIWESTSILDTLISLGLHRIKLIQSKVFKCHKSLGDWIQSLIINSWFSVGIELLRVLLSINHTVRCVYHLLAHAVRGIFGFGYQVLGSIS